MNVASLNLLEGSAMQVEANNELHTIVEKPNGEEIHRLDETRSKEVRMILKHLYIR